MNRAPGPFSAATRERARRHLRRLTTTLVVLSGAAAAFVGVLVTTEHPGRVGADVWISSGAPDITATTTTIAAPPPTTAPLVTGSSSTADSGTSSLPRR